MKLGRITEKQVTAELDGFAHLFGYEVIRLEQRRATKLHIGLPDRRYRSEKGCFFFESKAPDGKLTREQYAFLKGELEGGALASCGGLSEFRDLLAALVRPGGKAARDACWAALDAWRRRGFRGERKTLAGTEAGK